jgi:uncharacterized protein with LGFP repeats
MGWENSKLGFPVGDEKNSSGTLYTLFEGGSIKVKPDGSIEVGDRVD